MAIVGTAGTTPEVVVFLVGGIVEVCWHLPHSLMVLMASSMSLLYWEYHVWRHGLEALYCAPQVLVVVQRCFNKAAMYGIANES
jgi:hypothetical protein